MNEETYNLLRKICSDRKRFWRNENPDVASTYANILIMLEYANENDLEGLAQFDYYGEA